MLLVSGVLALPALGRGQPAEVPGLSLPALTDPVEFTDGTRVVSYQPLDALVPYEFGAAGPAWVKLLVRGRPGGRVMLDLTCRERSDSVTLFASARSPRVVFLLVPVGANKVRLTADSAIHLRVAEAQRPPLRSETKVTWGALPTGVAPGQGPLPGQTLDLREPVFEPWTQTEPRPEATGSGEPPDEGGWAQREADPEPSAPEPACERVCGGFVGAQASGFLPVGAWSRHVLAGQTLGETTIPADLTQFGPGFGGILEAGYKFRNRFGLGLRIELSSLATTDWDRYARQMGSDINSRAMRWSVEALWSIDLVRLDPVRLEARLGLGYTQAWGHEDNATHGLEYDYEFLEPSVSVRTGLGLGWEVTRGLEILALVDFQAGFPGLDYVSENAVRPLLGFGLGLGLRLYPARLAQRGE